MKELTIIIGEYIEDNKNQYDILTVTDSQEWAEYIIEIYNRDYDNIRQEKHYLNA
jgi:hypothetical protein